MIKTCKNNLVGFIKFNRLVINSKSYILEKLSSRAETNRSKSDDGRESEWGIDEESGEVNNISKRKLRTWLKKGKLTKKFLRKNVLKKV